MRFTEQIAIITEEKCRVLVTLEGDACVWDTREATYLQDNTPESQGKAAYAAKQAAIKRKLKTKFEQLWHVLDVSVNSEVGDEDEDSAPRSDAVEPGSDLSDGCPSDFESEIDD